MKVSYDVETVGMVASRRYEDEYNAIDKFIRSKHSNLCMEYDESDKVIYATLQAIRKYIFNHDLSITVHKRGKFLIILRKGEKK